MSAAFGTRRRSARRDGLQSQDAPLAGNPPAGDRGPFAGEAEPTCAPCEVPAGKEEGRDAGEREGAFECNICLDVATDPVVTQCGHLYCWPCIYKWLNVFLSRQQCPTCKAPIHEELLIPLYTRGFRPGQSAAARGASWGGAERVPVRPQGLRIANDHPRLANGLALPDLDLVGERLGGWGSHVVLGDLDGSHARISRAYDPFSMSLEQPQHVFLSRLLLLLGSFVILCLLIF